MTTIPGVPDVVVTGTYVTTAGTPMSGVVRFQPSQTVVHDDGTIIVPRAYGAVLRNGNLSIALPVTDDATLTPVNWFYHVTEDFPGGRTFDVQLPSTTPGMTLDLADFVPIDLVPPDLQGTIVGPPGPAGPPGPPGTLPVQIGGTMPTDPEVLVWYEVL